jgi:hypothetical protein
MRNGRWTWFLGVLFVFVVVVVIMKLNDRLIDEVRDDGVSQPARSTQRVSSSRAYHSDSDLDVDSMPFSVPAAPASISQYTDRLAGLEGGSLKYHQALKEIVSIWVANDPAGLADWLFELEKQGGVGSRMALNDMSKIWVMRDPLAAIDHFESSSLASESQRMVGLSVALMEWGKVAPQEAWGRYNTIPLMAEDSSVATEILSSWAEIDPQGASEKIAGLVNSGSDQAHMGNLAVAALLAEPEGIIEDVAEAAQLERMEDARLWLEALPVESVTRSVATSRLMSSWLSLDPQAASQWLVDQPESEARTNGIRSMANAITVEDPESAVMWAMELPQGNSQIITLSRAYDYWLAKDSVAAQEYANANFDEAIWQAISDDGQDAGEDITERE